VFACGYNPRLQHGNTKQIKITYKGPNSSNITVEFEVLTAAVMKRPLF
jgi:hypothetical protein